MIETFYSIGQLDASKAFFMSLIIGILFGMALEKAGFGSSRRLSGVFYFKDMTVIKVMFTAMITTIIGLGICYRINLISEQSIYLVPTMYSAQVIGGILFGIGFVMGGWCPGTAAVGVASGKWDALVFLGGTLGGSIFFNETYSLVKGFHAVEHQHILFVYDTIGISRDWFLLLFVLSGILVFWCMEWIEKKTTQKSIYLNSDFLKRFSLIFLIAGFSLFIISSDPSPAAKTDRPRTNEIYGSIAESEQQLLAGVDEALDHMEPEDIAGKLVSGQKNIVLVDVRSGPEFSKFHIRTALHIPLKDLAGQLESHKNKGMIVLYSNGMTHPAQARDSLFRMGFNNVYILTDGLNGFIKRCLKPVSLRSEPISESYANEINQWRQFFLETRITPDSDNAMPGLNTSELALPGIIDPTWLSSHLNHPEIRIIDLRSQPEYNTAHIPNSFALNVESLRGNIHGLPSSLLPAPILADHLSLMGIHPKTFVVLIYGEKIHDATLAGMAFERLGHPEYGLLSGGFMKLKTMGLSTDAVLPETAGSIYPDTYQDQFTVNYHTVLLHMKNNTALIIDVRPQAYYSGEKSDEARAGHIPGAVNRPFDLDTLKKKDGIDFKPVSELAAAYEQIIPSKKALVIVHCRTGHQASQTFFVLKHLLGYRRVLWYDAGWTEWAARAELPAKTGTIP